MWIIDILHNHNVWIAAAISAIPFIPIFFMINPKVIGYTRDNFVDRDPMPFFLGRMGIAIFMSAVYPLTLIALFTRSVMQDMDKRASKGQVETIRCYKCTAKISLQDSFCSTCGADQTAYK